MTGMNSLAASLFLQEELIQFQKHWELKQLGIMPHGNSRAWYGVKVIEALKRYETEQKEHREKSDNSGL